MQEIVMDVLLDFVIHLGKVFGLLIVMYFIVSFLNTYVPFKKMLHAVFSGNVIKTTIFSVLLGMISPFCSCTVMPVVLVLISTGVPIGAALSFFTSAALLNITSIISLATVLPVKTLLFYIILAIVVCLLVNLLFHLPFMKDAAAPMTSNNQLMVNKAELCFSFKEKLMYAAKNTLHILKKVWLYLVIGIALSVVLELLLNQNILSASVFDNRFITNPILAGLGTLIHSETIALLPLIQLFQSLHLSSMTIIMFVSLGTGVSIPLSTVLSKAVRVRHLLVYNGLIVAFYFILSLILPF